LGYSSNHPLCHPSRGSQRSSRLALRKIFKETSIKPIRNKKEFKAALARLNKVFDAEPCTKAADEAEVLETLIAAYEEKHFPIPPPDPH